MGTPTRTCIGGTSDCVSDTQLCIQVTGYGHIDQPQKVFFYQNDIDKEAILSTDQALQAAPDSEQDKAGGQLHTSRLIIECPSTLFNWKRENVTGKKLGLKIEKASPKGITPPPNDYIYLPIADTVIAGSNDHNEQFKNNILLAFIPLAIHDLPQKSDYFSQVFYQLNKNSTNNTQQRLSASKTSNVYYAPSRKGYIYIFWKDKLWRELQIEQDNQGKNIYKDINVQIERTGENNTFPIGIHQQYTSNMEPAHIRAAVGVALENIWLPYKLSGEYTKIHLLYSEDQLSGERLNYIEKNLNSSNNVDQNASLIGGLSRLIMKHHDNDRARDIIPMTTGAVSADIVNKETWAARIDYLPPMRARDDKVEWRLLIPSTYLTDITDKALQNKYAATQKIDSICKAASAPDEHIAQGNFNKLARTSSRFDEFEIDAWQDILAKQYEPETKPEDSFWDNDQTNSVQDVLEEYKNRYILGVAISDPINELHRLQRLLTTTQHSNLFKCLAQRTATSDKKGVGHFVSNAAYVHQDLRNSMAKVSKQIRHNYNLSIANAERTYLLNSIEQWQNQIAKLLQQDSTVEALINLVSNHEPFSYVANLHLIANSLQAISKAPIAYDPMSATLMADVTEGQLYIYDLAVSPANKLHQALWPATTFDELTQEQPAQIVSETNKGDGKWSPSTILAVGKIESFNQNQLTTLKAATLKLQAESQQNTNLDLLKDELKSGYSSLYNLFVILTDAVAETQKKRSAVEKALELVTEQKATNATAQGRSTQSQTQANSARQAHREAVQRGQTLETLQQQIDNRITFDQEKLAHLGLREQELLKKPPITFRNEAFLPFIKQLRTIPVFESIRYILPSQISNQLIALGLYNEGNLKALEALIVEFYGARAAGQTSLFTKFRQLLSKAGMNISNLAVDTTDFVLGMSVSEIKSRRRMLAVFASRLEITFIHLLEAVDLNNQRNVNLTEILKRHGVADALEQLAKRDAVAAAAARRQLDLATEALGARQSELRNVRNYSEIAEKNQGLLKSPMLPGILIIIEGWNILSVYRSYDKTAIQRGVSRADMGARSALWDGGLAILLFVERLEIQKLQFLTKTFEHINWVRNFGLGKTSALGLIGAGALALTAAINFWDAIYYYNRNNPAWLGYAMSGAGASMLTLQALLPAVIASMSWFVVGVVLLVAGAIVANYLDNSDKIKEWFIQGPFRDRVNTSYDHLQAPQEALYRLLSLLLYFTVEPEKIDKAQAQQQWQALAHAPLNETQQQYSQREQQRSLYFKIKQADLKVTVRCLCANFLTSCIYLPELAKYRKTEITYESTPSTEAHFERKFTFLELFEIMEYTPEGINLYLTLDKRDQLHFTQMLTTDLWLFKMQILAQPLDATLGSEFRVFPAPVLAYKEPYNPDKDSIPIFTNHDQGMINIDITTGQNFWFEATIKG